MNNNLDFPMSVNDIEVLEKTGFSRGGASGGMFAGFVNPDGVSGILPSGWTSEMVSTGIYIIRHNLDKRNIVVLTPLSSGEPPIICTPSSGENDFSVSVRRGSESVTSGFNFILVTI